jgi:phage terminase large subunit GpA-like protein
MFAAREEFKRFFRNARARQVRSMREFAESEIVVPDGPWEGRRFRCYRQPYSGLFFDAVDSGRWNRFAATGPTQSGKSLTCFITPTLYHLFECQETVICGLPEMDMAKDKWFEDLLPSIEKSRYRDLLPLKGAGSKGGVGRAIRFRNGATLRFMTGGGDDKSRAGFTSRILVVTEVDGLDTSASTSREASKLKQLEGRVRAYGSRSRVYLECTVSIEEGAIWQEWTKGTKSRLALPCPHCGQYVTPEREMLIGWQEAESEQEAREKSLFFCSAQGCGQAWSDLDRKTANENAVLVHRDQEIIPASGPLASGPLISGEPPATATLGFRWTAVNNMFTTAGEIGAGEWKAARAFDEEGAEKEQRKFVWCLPHLPPAWESNPLDAAKLLSRQHAEGKGVVPDEVMWITAAMDLGKWLCHWVVCGWRGDGRGYVIEHGRIETPTAELGEQAALKNAMLQFRDLCETGWLGFDGQMNAPDWAIVDSGNWADEVYAFIRECRQAEKMWILPAKGFGAGQERSQWYNRPKSTGGIVKHVGESFHISWHKPESLFLMEVDANQWKGQIHSRLSCTVEAPGALTFYRGDNPREHMSFVKQLTAEKEIEEFVEGKGLVRRWVPQHKNNHWLDALYNAAAAGSLCGASIVEPYREPARQEPAASRPAEESERTSMFNLDERAFYSGDRP